MVSEKQNNDQKRIWAVSSGSYSDYDVHAVFSSEEKAQAYLDEYKKLDSDADLESFDFDPPVPQVITVTRVTMDKDGVVHRILKYARNIISDGVLGLMYYAPYLGNEQWAVLVINTEDEKTAIKAANEKRTQAIAMNVWGNYQATKELGL